MIGWIKLHRKILGSNMYRSLNSKQRDVMIAVLLSVNFEEHEWEWEGKVYRCMPGQCVTSLQKLASLCGCDVKVQSVRTALLKLEKWGFLTNVSTKTGRLITIVNWDRYQAKEIEVNKDTNKQLTKDQQSSNKELTTNKEREEIKKGKEDNIADSVPKSANLTLEDENEPDKKHNGRILDSGARGIDRQRQGESLSHNELPAREDIKPGSQTLLPGIGEQGTTGDGDGTKHELPQVEKYDPKNDDGSSKNRVAKPFTLSEVREMRLSWWSEEEWEDLIDLRRKKKAAQTKRAYNQLINEFEKAKERGYTADEIMNAMNSGKGWSGFKLDWMKEPPSKKNGIVAMSMEDKIYVRKKECQGCDTMIYTGKCDAINTLLGYPCKERLEHVD